MEGGAAGSPEIEAGAGGVAANGGSAGGSNVEGGAAGAFGAQGGTAGAPNAQGGTAGAPQTSAPTISTSTLPGAAFNSPYSLTLVATGGSSNVYEWSLASGSLPQGLTLSADGVLSGVPVASGSFSLTIAVKNPGGPSAQRVFTLNVTRQRWLAYTSDKKATGVIRPYLLDLTSSTFAEVELATGLGASCSASSPKFSPDGKRLAYLGGVGSGCTSALFVVDVSGATAGTPARADGTGGAYLNYGFSPDSRWLAFQRAGRVGAVTTWTADIAIVDVSGANTGAPTTVAAAQPFDVTTESYAWADASNFAWFDPNYYVRKVTRSGTSWLGPTTLTTQFGGGLLQKSFFDGFVIATGSHAVMATGVLDVVSGSVKFYPQGSVSFDHGYAIVPTLDVVALEGYTPGLQKVSGSLALAFSSTMPPVWGESSNRALLPAESSTAEVRFLDARGATPSLVDVTGTAGITWLKFARNDAWAAFGSSTQWSVAAVGASLGALKPVSVAPASGMAHTASFAFAPNSRALIYGSKQTASSSDNDLYLVDISSAVFTAPRRISASLTPGSAIGAKGFSPDSSFAYFVSGGSFYVASTLVTNGLGQLVTSKVASFAFQP